MSRLPPLILALLATGCGPNQRSDHHVVNHVNNHANTRVNNLGHHSSNEDEKMRSFRVSQFDSFANKLFGRYRGESSELLLCNTVVETYARGMYLERSVGSKIVERRLWLSETADAPDSIQEFELLRAPSSVACHDLPLQLSPEVVGKSLRSWTMPTSTFGWNEPPESFFVQTTIAGKTLRYERSLHGMVRIEAQDRREYRTLHLKRPDIWYLPEAKAPDEALTPQPPP